MARSSKSDVTQAAETMDMVRKRWTSADNMRQRYDWLWEICIRKHAGQHWLAWDGNSNRFIHAPAQKKGMVLRRTNLIRSASRRLKSIMKRSFPKSIVQPGQGPGSMERKRMAADIGNGLLRNWDESLDQNAFLDRMLETILVTGNVFRGAGWDADAETAIIETDADPVKIQEKRRVDVSHCPACNYESMGNLANCPSCNSPIAESQISSTEIMEEREEIPTDKNGVPLTKRVPQGDVTAPFVSSLEIYPGRRAVSLESAGYIFRLRFLPAAQVKAMTGEDVKASSITDNRLRDWYVNEITGLNQDYSVDTVDEDVISDLVFFLEYLAKPTVGEPEGLYMAFGDESLTKPIAVDTYNARVGETKLPFGMSHYKYINVANRFWGASFVEDAFPINDQLNTENTQEDYMRTRFLYSKWFIYEGSEVSEARLSGANDVVRCNEPDQTPKHVTPSIPPQLSDHRNTEHRFEEMSLLSDSLQGNQPGSTRAGNAIAQLNEAALSPILDIVAYNAVQDSKIWKSLLGLAQKKYTDERQIEVLGPGSTEEFKVYQAMDFKEPGLTIKVETDILVPVTREQRRNGVQVLLQYTQGAFFQLAMQDPQMMQEVLDLAGLSKERFNVDYNQQTSVSALELERFLREPQNNQLIVDELIDNHAIHYQQNERWLNDVEGVRFRFAQQGSPERQIFDTVKQHMFEHQQILQAKLQQQAQVAPPPAG